MAMTIKTRTELKSENSADFPDNSTRLISPADLRGQMDDVVDSALLREDIIALDVSQSVVTATADGTKTLAAWTRDILDGSGGGSGDATTLDGQEGTYYLDRANHTGSQATSTVTGLDAALAGFIDSFTFGPASDEWHTSFIGANTPTGAHTESLYISGAGANWDEYWYGATLWLSGDQYTDGGGQFWLSASANAVRSTIAGGGAVNSELRIGMQSDDTGTLYRGFLVIGGGYGENSTRGSYLFSAGNHQSSHLGRFALVAGDTSINNQVLGGTAANTAISIFNRTADGADSGKIAIAAGGVASASTRGAFIDLQGNEHATKPGRLELNAGDTGYVAVQSGVAVPAGGSAVASIRMSNIATLGIYFGSGVPTITAAKGSLYMRTDGTTTNDRMYVNTNGSTTWTNVTTAA